MNGLIVCAMCALLLLFDMGFISILCIAHELDEQWAQHGMFSVCIMVIAFFFFFIPLQSSILNYLFGDNKMEVIWISIAGNYRWMSFNMVFTYPHSYVAAFKIINEFPGIVQLWLTKERKREGGREREERKKEKPLMLSWRMRCLNAIYSIPKRMRDTKCKHRFTHFKPIYNNNFPQFDMKCMKFKKCSICKCRRK